MNLNRAVKEQAAKIGFDLVGVAPVNARNDLEFSRCWVEQGYGGEMRYLANPKRHDPRSVLPSVKSVVCVGLVYNAPLPYSEEVSPSTDGQKSEGSREESEVRSQESETTTPSAVSCPSSVATADEQRMMDDGKRTTDDEPRAWISRYAWGRDYHQVMRAKLEKLRAGIEALALGVETRVYVDTGPIVERALARFSGIGWMGKNTCLINQEKGSWFFLGVILTSLALEPYRPAPDRCGSCTRCLEACPTGALVEPYVMDASRCIAYFNIELKGSIPVGFREAIGANVFGCDICQDVCPWNGRSQDSVFRIQEPGVGTQNSEVRSQNENRAPGVRAGATTALSEFQPLEINIPSPQSLTPGPCSPSPQPQVPGPQSLVPNTQNLGPNTFSLFNPPLAALAAMSEGDFRRAFANSPIRRVKYRGWLRNLCVAMGNSGDPRFVPKLRELAAHPDPIVREHAEWALGRLRGL